MRIEVTAICSRFQAKTSSTGNLYYTVDITETVETGNPEQPKMDITFKDLYYNTGSSIPNYQNYIGRQVVVEISVYPVNRPAGEKVYQDIKLKLESIELK